MEEGRLLLMLLMWELLRRLISKFGVIGRKID